MISFLRALEGKNQETFRKFRKFPNYPSFSSGRLNGFDSEINADILIDCSDQ